MSRKKILALSAFLALIIGTVAMVKGIEKTTVVEAAGETATGIVDDSTNSSEMLSQSSDPSTLQERKSEAEDLIGESLTREEIESILGEYVAFDMHSNGCERGVYAGEFDYGDFMIFSRTYDKGKTFRIVSVNQ